MVSYVAAGKRPRGEDNDDDENDDDDSNEHTNHTSLQSNKKRRKGTKNIVLDSDTASLQAALATLPTRGYLTTEEGTEQEQGEGEVSRKVMTEHRRDKRREQRRRRQQRKREAERATKKAAKA